MLDSAVRLDPRLMFNFRVHIMALARTVLELEETASDNAGIELSRIFDRMNFITKHQGSGAPSVADLHLGTSEVLQLGLATVDASYRYHSTVHSADMNLHIAGARDFGKLIAAARRDKRFKEFFTKLDAADGLE